MSTTRVTFLLNCSESKNRKTQGKRTDLHQIIAKELKEKSQMTAAVALLDEGATGPFIVHYQKEGDGGLE